MYSMADHPVVLVSWYGAVVYGNWLSEIQGLQPVYDPSSWERIEPLPNGYRIPTEAEWERAAAWDNTGEGKHWRYGVSSDTIDSTNANFKPTTETAHINPLGLTSHPYTSPVGWFNGVNVSPNGNVQTLNAESPVGAFDMAGNAVEWCHDRWYRTYTTDPVTNPTGPTSGDGRLQRGGSYTSVGQNNCRSARRGVDLAHGRQNVYSFRVVRTL